MSHKKCQLISEHSKLLTGAFVSAHPQVVPNSIQLCIAIARYNLLRDIKQSMNYPADWITLENIALSSPSATTIGRCVKELAILQLIVSRQLLKTDSSYFQTDGGHKHQEFSLFSRYNHQQREVQQIWAGCTNVGGKLSSDIALEAKLRMKLNFPHWRTTEEIRWHHCRLWARNSRISWKMYATIGSD